MKKTLLVVLYLCSLCIAVPSLAADKAADKKTEAVATQVEALRKAMVDGDGAKLKALTSTELSYGHSGGHVDDQTEFVDKLTSGKSDFVTIELQDQTIKIVDDVALVRHRLLAKTNDNGKPADVDIGVLLVWQKHNGQWVLLARQAFKTH